MPSVEFEYEAIAQDHSVRIPNSVPDGARVRVRLIVEQETAAPEANIKALLAGLTEGLTDEDLARPREFGREVPEWDT